MFVIRCKTCSKISKRNFVNKPKIESKKEFEKCVAENHNVKVEKM